MFIDKFKNLIKSLVLVFCMVLITDASAFSAEVEIKGAAILEHSCGKVAVQHANLAHAGKLEEAAKLSAKSAQKEWKAVPAEERKSLTEMIKEMSPTGEQLAAYIKENGVLVINGKSATLTVEKNTKVEGGVMTETITRRFEIDAAGCRTKSIIVVP